jgi:dolichol kinase
VPGAFAAALAELLLLPVDDNLSVPLFAAAAMTLLAS